MGQQSSKANRKDCTVLCFRIQSITDQDSVLNMKGAAIANNLLELKSENRFCGGVNRFIAKHFREVGSGIGPPCFGWECLKVEIGIGFSAYLNFSVSSK